MTLRRVDRRKAVLAVALVALIVMVTGVTAVFYPSRAFAASSTLGIVDGTVFMKHVAANSFDIAVDGQTLYAGDVIRTDTDSRAVLTYFDGSITEVEPSSEIVVEQLSATAGGDFVVVIRQTAGHTWHVVGHALSPNSRYEVRTPSATASVRGTAFHVIVSEDVPGQTKTEVVTREGIVNSSTAAGSVDVGVDQRSVATDPQKPPEEPRPAPQPERSVTVVIDAPNGAVKNEQTKQVVAVVGDRVFNAVPDSKARVVNGKTEITLPDTKGTISAFAKDAKSPVEVEVKVTERGRVVAEAKAVTVETSSGNKAAGFDVTPSNDPTKPVDVTPIPEDQLKNVSDPKVGKAPDVKAPDALGLALGAGGPSPEERAKKLMEEQKRAAVEMTRTAEEQKRAADEQARKVVEGRQKASDLLRSATTDEQRKAAEAALKSADEQLRAADATRRAADAQLNVADALARSASLKDQGAPGAGPGAAQELQRAVEQHKRAGEEQRKADDARRAAEAVRKAAEGAPQRLPAEAPSSGAAAPAKPDTIGSGPLTPDVGGGVPRIPESVGGAGGPGGGAPGGGGPGPADGVSGGSGGGPPGGPSHPEAAGPGGGAAGGPSRPEAAGPGGGGAAGGPSHPEAAGPGGGPPGGPSHPEAAGPGGGPPGGPSHPEAAGPGGGAAGGPSRPEAAGPGGGGAAGGPSHPEAAGPGGGPSIGGGDSGRGGGSRPDIMPDVRGIVRDPFGGRPEGPPH